MGRIAAEPAFLTPWRDDPVSRIASLSGDYGRAWPIAPFAPNMIAQWLIEAPWANPLWHSYVISLYTISAHYPPLQVSYWSFGQDTHKVVLYALDPTYPREAISAQGTLQALKPANFTAQFVEDTPGEALLRVRLAVSAICAGLLDPDADTSHALQALFGTNQLKPRN